MVGNYSGNLFIVAAPSGGGKTSLVRNLIETLEQIDVSISHTTRVMRPGEVHGVDYFFVDESQFTTMINEGAFIEHAQVFSHLYGTSRAQISERLECGIDVVLDIDWQGAAQIKKNFPEAVSIFIIPPSIEALKERLTNRGQDNDEIIRGRMKKAQDELSHYSEFDYLIVNDTFEHAAADLCTIVLANRLRIERQVNKQAKLLSFLMSSQ
ncbi:guanylate kinase [Legionella sp.]|uniref:guanylate kinase n=1 Tax=Legionella sp. TaxID=459 RepID=UPI003D124BCF